MLIRAKVDFRKPDIKALRQKGMCLVDMHFHTRYSDTYTRVSSILKRAEKLGIGVAITDHNEIQGSVEAYRKKEDQLVIPGVEVTCYERCHLLFYFAKVSELEDFYYDHVEPYKSKNPYSVTKVKTNTILKAAQDYDSIVSAAHPFAGFTGIFKGIKRRHLHPSVVDKLSAIEVMNGASLNWMNWKALAWAEDMGKPITGGSDGHTLAELGKIVTYSTSRSLRGFMKKICEQENFVIGKRIGLITQLNAKSRVISRHLKYIRPTLRIRYEVSVKPSVRYHVPVIRKKIKKARAVGVERVRDVAQRSIKKIDYKFEKVPR